VGQGYQDRDYELIDYELYELSGFARPFRGPQPRGFDRGAFGICVGAAQTFGCYAPSPFPQLLSEALDLPVMNMGVAGAGPSFFLRRNHFIDLINQSGFAVLQIMSGRSESNSLLGSMGGEMLIRRCDSERIGAAPAWQQLLDTLPRADLDTLIAETRANWLSNMRALLFKVTVPTLLFWFSERPPDYRTAYSSVHSLFGAFPQFIDRAMLESLVELAPCVEMVSSEGLPQTLTSRFTGETASITMRKDLGGGEKQLNNYYPSPQMHRLAASSLLPHVHKMMSVGH
jgi:hypothetical protein